MTALHTKKLEASMSPAERGKRERRVARAVKSGASIEAAARMGGISEKEVRRICDAMGVARRIGRRSGP